MKNLSLSNRYSLKITLVYLLLSGIWIIFSDKLLASLVGDPDLFLTLQTYKGLLFVLGTAGLLYYLINNATSSLVKSREHLESALREKQVILGELHHRVKNNLAIISGLIELQLDELPDKDQDILRTTQYRIYSLADIQELLFREENLASVPFHEHIKNITSSLENSNGQNPVIFNTDNVYININQAIPLSLLINEILSQVKINRNAHWEFPVNITITHQDADAEAVSVIFHFKKLPNDIMERLTNSKKHLEATLINVYTKQLKADSEWTNVNGGTSFHLEFRKSERPGPSSSFSSSIH